MAGTASGDGVLAALVGRVEALEQERTRTAALLEALEQERAVLQTLYAYGHAIDAGDEAGWLDCFTADGRFSASLDDRDAASFDVRGQEALADFIARHTRRPGVYHAHLLIEPRIEIAGDAARCSAYFVVLLRHDEVPRIRAFGRYADELARGTDGRWRFRHRHAHIDGADAEVPAPAFNHVPGT